MVLRREAARRASHFAACRRCVRWLSTIVAMSETEREPLPRDDDSELKLPPEPGVRCVR
jgi:hypothetical protein